MKKNVKSISNPDELNKNLQYTSPITWIVLGFTIVALAGFFIWSSLYRIKVKISGDAIIKDHQVTLVIEETKKEKLAIGQKVIIDDKEGTILSLDNNEPVVSAIELNDGDYTYTIILEEISPIEFLFNK